MKPSNHPSFVPVWIATVPLLFAIAFWLVADSALAADGSAALTRLQLQKENRAPSAEISCAGDQCSSIPVEATPNSNDEAAIQTDAAAPIRESVE